VKNFLDRDIDFVEEQEIQGEKFIKNNGNNFPKI
jgi:hypothetical protein